MLAPPRLWRVPISSSKTMALSDKDKELIEAASGAIKKRYRNEWQEVGAALRTRDGRVVTGVNIDAYIGRIAVCAEAIAVGRADHRRRRPRHRNHRRGPPSEAAREGPAHQGGVALRHLPRTDLRLRPESAGHCPQWRRSRWSRPSPNCSRTSIIGAPNEGFVSAHAQHGFAGTARGRHRGGLPASAEARRIRRPATGALQSRCLHPCGARARRGARSCVVCRSAGPRQDHAGANPRARTRREFPRHLRSRHRQGRRSRGAAHQSRRSRRSLY